MLRKDIADGCRARDDRVVHDDCLVRAAASEVAEMVTSDAERFAHLAITEVVMTEPDTLNDPINWSPVVVDCQRFEPSSRIGCDIRTTIERMPWIAALLISFPAFGSSTNSGPQAKIGVVLLVSPTIPPQPVILASIHR
jgi:hypothetical protein